MFYVDFVRKIDINFEDLLLVRAHHAGEVPKFWPEHLLHENGK